MQDITFTVFFGFDRAMYAVLRFNSNKKCALSTLARPFNHIKLVPSLLPLPPDSGNSSSAQTHWRCTHASTILFSTNANTSCGWAGSLQIQSLRTTNAGLVRKYKIYIPSILTHGYRQAPRNQQGFYGKPGMISRDHFVCFVQ